MSNYILISNFTDTKIALEIEDSKILNWKKDQIASTINSMNTNNILKTAFNPLFFSFTLCTWGRCPASSKTWDNPIRTPNISRIISLHLSDNADTAEQISVMQILEQNSSSWKWPTTSI